MHMPNQGTLHIAHEGTLATYSRFDLNNAANELRFPTPGTLMPHIYQNDGSSKNEHDSYFL